MMKVLLVLCFLAIGSLAVRTRFDGNVVYRVVPKNDQHLTVLQDLGKEEGISFWENPDAFGENVDVVVPPEKKSSFLETMKKAGLEQKVFVQDLQKAINEEEKELLKRSKNMDWTSYHTLEEYFQWMNNLTNNSKDVREVLIGKSYEGRDIKGIEIFNSFCQPTVFIESGMHGREWICPAATSYVVNEILKSPKDSIFRKFNYIYVPILNPDGYVYSWEHNRLWRKTRKPYFNKWGTVCYGADLNRNFDVDYPHNKQYWDPCNDFNSGPEAFSEVESKALAKFLNEEARRRNIDVYLSFHSYSQRIMYPWGARTNSTPLADTWKRIATAAATDLQIVDGAEFAVGNIYNTSCPTYGTSVDWFYKEHNATIPFLYSLRDKGLLGLILPPRYILPSGKELLASIKRVLLEYSKLPQ